MLYKTGRNFMAHFLIKLYDNCTISDRLFTLKYVSYNDKYCLFSINDKTYDIDEEEELLFKYGNKNIYVTFAIEKGLCLDILTIEP